MASDPVRGRVVLFGADAATASPQTWEWDGATWQSINPALQPPVRDRGAMAFDPVRQRILFTGGTTVASPVSGLTDAWEWDGVVWQQLAAVANRPTALVHQTTTDLGNGRVLFVDAAGGVNGWDGSTWQLLGSAPTGSPGPMGSAAAWDEVRGRLVFQLYADYSVFLPFPPYSITIQNWELFEWDGAFQLISSLPGGGPLNRAQPMFFDAERQRVCVLDLPDFTSPLSTREWSGSWYLAGQQAVAWNPLQTSVAYDHANASTMVYDGAVTPPPLTRSFRLVSSTPAGVLGSGTGCPGSLGTPVLAAAPYSRPWIGDDFAVEVNNVPAGSLPFVVVGFATANVGLGAFGMPACQLLATFDAFEAMAPAPSQEATWSLHVPSMPALAGAQLHLQGALLSAGGSGPLGVALSQRLTATVGVR